MQMLFIILMAVGANALLHLIVRKNHPVPLRPQLVSQLVVAILAILFVSPKMFDLMNSLSALPLGHLYAVSIGVATVPVTIHLVTNRFPVRLGIVTGVWFVSFFILSLLSMKGTVSVAGSIVFPMLVFVSVTVGLTVALLVWLRKDYEVSMQAVTMTILGVFVFLFLLDLPYPQLLTNPAAWVLHLMFAGFAAVFTVDWRHHLIPNRLTSGLAVLAVILCILWFPSAGWSNLLYGLGLTAGFYIAFLIARGTLGFGDVKLAFPIGVLMMGQIMPYLLYTTLSGALVAVALMIFKKKKGNDAIAFGPFMILGMILVFLLV